ncbi:hypothetical protein NKJ09_22975 [Mesorhizobium sp. M0189]|uniref:hypothetical protein n=1 Tax=Mesorhizobium sp. M0189 TaxID=2956909 RepID=UPI00333C2826
MQNAAARVRKLQLAIKAEKNAAMRRALKSRLRDLCADLAKRDFRDKLANMGRMPSY